MKHVAILLSITCLLVFVACGQGDKTEKAAVSESEKATEMVKEKPEETTEMVKEKPEETTVMAKEKPEETTVMATEQQGLVDKARVTFESFMADKDQSWLKENLNQAKGLMIIPSLLKAGFVIGGSGDPWFRNLWASDRCRGSGSYYDGEDPEGCGCTVYLFFQARG